MDRNEKKLEQMLSNLGRIDKEKAELLSSPECLPRWKMFMLWEIPTKIQSFYFLHARGCETCRKRLQDVFDEVISKFKNEQPYFALFNANITREAPCYWAAARTIKDSCKEDVLPEVEFCSIKHIINDNGIKEAWLIRWDAQLFLAIKGEARIRQKWDRGIVAFAKEGSKPFEFLPTEEDLTTLLFGNPLDETILIFECASPIYMLSLREIYFPQLVTTPVRLEPVKEKQQDIFQIVQDLVERNKLSAFMNFLPKEAPSEEGVLLVNLYLRILNLQNRLISTDKKLLNGLDWIASDLKSIK